MNAAHKTSRNPLAGLIARLADGLSSTTVAVCFLLACVGGLVLAIYSPELLRGLFAPDHPSVRRLPDYPHAASSTRAPLTEEGTRQEAQRALQHIVNSEVLTFETADTSATVLDFYRDVLRKEGWDEIGENMYSLPLEQKAITDMSYRIVVSATTQPSGKTGVKVTRLDFIGIGQ